MSRELQQDELVAGRQASETQSPQTEGASQTGAEEVLQIPVASYSGAVIHVEGMRLPSDGQRPVTVDAATSQGGTRAAISLKDGNGDLCLVGSTTQMVSALLALALSLVKRIDATTIPSYLSSQLQNLHVDGTTYRNYGDDGAAVAVRFQDRDLEHSSYDKSDASSLSISTHGFNASVSDTHANMLKALLSLAHNEAMSMERRELHPGKIS